MNMNRQTKRVSEMTKCIVTGGAGFIGSHLVSALLECGHDIIIIDDLSNGNIHNLPSSCKLINKSLEDVETSVFQDVDVVFHLASHSGEAVSFFSPSESFTRNVASATNVLLNCVRSGVRRIVFTSSMAVYGNQLNAPFSEDDPCKPSDPYGLSKLTIEKLIEMYADHSNLEWSILRLHNVYGPKINLNNPYRGVVGIFINRLIREKPPIIYGDGEQLRAFTYIEDIISCIADAGFNKECNKEIINLGSGNVSSILDLANSLCELMSDDTKPIFLPPRIAEVRNAFTTTKKSERILGFKDNTSFREGLIRTLKWAKEQETKCFDYGLMDIELDMNGKLPIPWKNRIL
jgi:UDP-glucose 4-epimerase